MSIPTPANFTNKHSSLFSLPVDSFNDLLTNNIANRTELTSTINQHLKDGIDYTSLVFKRGTTKKFLTKAGADKLATICGLTGQFEITTEQDFVISKATILFNGSQVGEGIGARSFSQDLMWSNKNQVNDVNKTCKMSKKSAWVDGIINALGLSDEFSQDAESVESSEVQAVRKVKPNVNTNTKTRQPSDIITKPEAKGIMDKVNMYLNHTEKTDLTEWMSHSGFKDFYELTVKAAEVINKRFMAKELNHG
ncbi:hypothetical protein QUF74_05540 [Candidatus Halobeggiatoa sp. HSG11]|nr:hypothetical protein [Candidatus Halobeggiatoa sp. HSG11]